MTQPAICPSLSGRPACVSCLRPWGILAERLDAIACRALDRPPAHTRLSPSDNDKAERFIRTMLSGWAYAATCSKRATSAPAALDGWLWHYNCQQGHPALGHKRLIARLDARRANLLGTYT
jgi:transposase InsO family protein